MSQEPDLEELLRDDIMQLMMRSARVTGDELRRQLAAVTRRSRQGKSED